MSCRKARFAFDSHSLRSRRLRALLAMWIAVALSISPIMMGGSAQAQTMGADGRSAVSAMDCPDQTGREHDDNSNYEAGHCLAACATVLAGISDIDRQADQPFARSLAPQPKGPHDFTPGSDPPPPRIF